MTAQDKPRKGGRKRIAAQTRKITMLLPLLAHARLQQMADKRGGIPLAALLRRMLEVFSILDRLMARTPGGQLGIYDPTTKTWYPVEVPIDR